MSAVQPKVVVDVVESSIVKMILEFLESRQLHIAQVHKT